MGRTLTLTCLLVVWTSALSAQEGEQSEAAEPTVAVEAPQVEASVLNAPESEEAEPVRFEFDAEARARFEAGELAYASGRFEAALADFRQAHALSGRDELLYNIGLAAERLRRDDEAIEAFEQFLESTPGHPRTAALRRRIELLREEQRVREQAAASVVDEPDAPAVVLEPPPSRVGPVVLGISGALLAAGGGVLLALAVSDRNTLETLPEPRPWNELSSMADSVPRRSTAGIALLAAGSAAMIGALIWRLAQPSGPSVEVSLSPSGAHLRGTF